MMGQHAVISPSGFKALMLCPAKPAMEKGLPDRSSKDADEGTWAHDVAAARLRHWVENATLPPYSDDVPAEMREAVDIYVDEVRQRVEGYRLAGAQVEVYIEQPVPIGHVTGEEEAHGTADCIIVAATRDDTRIVVEVGDLKYGKGVEVAAENNPQLRLYALGAIDWLSAIYGVTEVAMWICQPRLSSVASDGERMSAQDLVQWGVQHATPAADFALHLYDMGPDHAQRHATPNAESCRWCRAKPTCLALAGAVSSTLEAEFEDLTTASPAAREDKVQEMVQHLETEHLGAKMDAIPLIEMWCKAIRGEVEKSLLAGMRVPGYKLVAGKRGARAWTSAQEAEAAMRAMKLKRDQMYDFSVISPTTAEKLLKETPRKWAKLTHLISQSEGKPSVAPESDKRPAIEVRPIAEEFAPITESIPAGAEDLL